MINRSGDARVGCAQHGSPQFEGSHSRNLQVLRQGVRAAKPGDVAHIDQNRRPLFDPTSQFFAKQIFVTDIECNPLISNCLLYTSDAADE